MQLLQRSVDGNLLMMLLEGETFGHSGGFLAPPLSRFLPHSILSLNTDAQSSNALANQMQTASRASLLNPFTSADDDGAASFCLRVCLRTAW